MKKLLLAITALIAAGSLSAQNEQLHIYRNDNKFATHKGAEISNISFAGTDRMTVTDLDGKAYQYPMSAVDSCVLRPDGIPEIFVTLTDYPDWTELQGAKDDVRAATLYMKGNGMYDDLPEQTVELRGRGNSTWNMPKKPYRFKMAKKTSVCGLPKAKTFALLANFIDCTLTRNAVAMWIARYLEMPYSNHIIPVKVYLNGHYKGQYVMTEKIGVGGGSVDIDETTGMLFELDTNYDEDFKFRYTWRNGNVQESIPVMVKDPDLAELAEDPDVPGITNANDYFALWQADFTRMADIVTSRKATESLSDVLDIESVVNYFLVFSLCGNHELVHPKSMYMHKLALGEDEVYHFGPVWDFDWAFTFNGKEGAPANEALIAANGKASGYAFFKLIMANQEVRNLFKEKFDDFVANGYPQLIDFINEYATLIEPSAKENGILWPSQRYQNSYRITGSFELRDNIETLKKWLDSRINFMKTDKNYGLYQ